MKKILAARSLPGPAAPPVRSAGRLSGRVSGAMALIALVAVLGLLPGHRARSAGGAVAVQITNPTLATVDAENAARQPFVTSVNVSIGNGSGGGAANGDITGVQSFAVPAGQRLVVENVSMYRTGAASGQSVQVFTNASSGGAYASFALPPVPATAAQYCGIGQAERFYADPGTRVVVNAFRTGNTGAETDTVSFSGYLVNVP